MRISGRLTIQIIGIVLPLALLTSCTGQLLRPSARSIVTGISGALAASSTDRARVDGCLSSLGFWSDEVAKDLKLALHSGGMFFLGDSYLYYRFAILSDSAVTPVLTLQTDKSTKQVALTPNQSAELSNFIATARYDPAPQQTQWADHMTCVVFLDRAGHYFVVNPDEASDSSRSTDRAITLLKQAARDAP